VFDLTFFILVDSCVMNNISIHCKKRRSYRTLGKA